VNGIIDTQSFTTTLSGPLSGSGSLTKDSSGTLIFTGASNGYTGDIFLDLGTLNIQNSAALGTGTLSFVGNNTILQAGVNDLVMSNPLHFNSSVNGIINTQGFTMAVGALSGSGSLTKEGSGTLVLTSASDDYTGDIFLDLGTINVQNSTSLGTGTLFFATNNTVLQAGANNLDIGTSLTFDSSVNGIIDTQDYAMTLSGSLSGAGSLTKVGSGLLDLLGNDTYTGSTSVNAGRLSVNGSLVSPVTVAPGATLGGTGTITNTVTIENAAILSPGNSVGTLTIATLILNSGSITRIEVDPTQSSELIITSGATIDGLLEVVPDLDDYSRSDLYTILTGPYSGTFNDLTYFDDGFQYTPIYLPNLIQLSALWLGIDTTGLSGNAKKVAKYLNKHAPIAPALMELASLSGEELKRALNSVSPARNALPIFVAQNTYFALSEIVNSHLSQQRFLKALQTKNKPLALNLIEDPMYLADASDQIPPASAPQKQNNPPYALWIGAFGEYFKGKEQHQTPGFEATTEGVLGAFDYYAKERGMAGMALGYAHTHLHEYDDAGKASINYFYSSLYGTVQASAFYMDVAAWWGYQDIENQRHIFYPGFEKTAKAYFHAWQLSPHLEFGGDVDFSWGGLEPYVAFDFVSTWQEKFKERGAGTMNMRQKSHYSSLLRSALGLRLYESWSGDWGCVLLKEEAGYVNKKIFHTGDVTTVIVGGTGSLFVETLQPTQNLGLAAAEVLYAPSNAHSPELSLGYFGEFGSKTQAHEVLLKIVKKF
jgi:autotransporter-associated beta strand protein